MFGTVKTVSRLDFEAAARPGSLTALESMLLTTSRTCAPLHVWNARITAKMIICSTECIAAWVAQQNGLAVLWMAGFGGGQEGIIMKEGVRYKRKSQHGSPKELPRLGGGSSLIDTNARENNTSSTHGSGFIPVSESSKILKYGATTTLLRNRGVVRW